MSKRSKEDVEKLASKAFELLGSGYTQAQAAEKLGVSVRTIQRWVKDGDFRKPEVKAQATLVEVANQATAVKVREVLPLQDLADYHQSQKLAALEHGEIAAILFPKVKEALENLLPSDIPVRLLPSMYKMIIDARNSENDCFARATGLEEVLNVFQEQIDSNGET